MKVLIVKVSALGDVIHSLPVLAYLHSACPEVEIDWMVEEGFSSVLNDHPLIDRVIPIKTKHWRKLSLLRMLKEVGSFIGELRQSRYDFVFDLQGNSKSGFFTLLSRGRGKYGFDFRQVREWPNLLATNHRVALSEEEHHVAQRALAVVQAAVPSAKMPPLAGPLHVLPEAREQVERQLQELQLGERSLVVLHYGTTWQTKLWSLEGWQQLAVKLINQTKLMPLLTWGNEAELQAATAIARATDNRALIWPRGSLPELVALLKRVDLVVGCDTGPIHIAAALGTPTVSLYRVTDARRNGPLGDNHRCLQTPLECARCLRKECERDEQCSMSITAEEVYRAIIELTGQPKGSTKEMKEAIDARKDSSAPATPYPGFSTGRAASGG